MHRKNDISIEAVRIIACFFVICIHISLGNYINDQVSRSAVFLACIRADAVALFWFVTGAFFFRSSNYKKSIKRMLKKIVLPMFIISLVMFYFQGWIYDGETLASSMSHGLSDYLNFFKGFSIDWKTYSHLGPYWYLYVYILVCITQPIGKVFVDHLDRTDGGWRRFLGVSFGILVLNDLSLNSVGSFSHRPFGAFIPAYIVILWGYFIYRNREIISEKIKIIWFIISFFGVNLARCLVQTWSYQQENSSEIFLWWYSAYGLVCVVCIYMTMYKVTGRIKGTAKSGDVIAHFGGMTYCIYLVHKPVIDFLNKFSLNSNIYARINVHNVFVRQLLYYIGFGMIVFFSSYFLALCIMSIKKSVGHLSNV